MDIPFIYFSEDLEKGVGFLKNIPNCFVLCWDYLDTNFPLSSDEKKRIITLDVPLQLKGYEIPDYLIRNDCLKNVVKKIGTDKALWYTFRPHGKIQQYLQKKYPNIKDLNEPVRKVQKIEDKLAQMDILNAVNDDDFQSKRMKLSEIDYDVITKEWGSRFILQFNKGHSGNSTIKIQSSEGLSVLQKDFPNRTAKIIRFLENTTAVTTNNILVGGKISFHNNSIQITGYRKLTENEFSTVGNYFSNSQFSLHNYQSIPKSKILNSEKIFELIQKFVKEKIEPVLCSDDFDYVGLIGFDFLIQEEKMYLIEINPRQTQSVSLEFMFDNRLLQTALSSECSVDSREKNQKLENKEQNFKNQLSVVNQQYVGQLIKRKLSSIDFQKEFPHSVIWKRRSGFVGGNRDFEKVWITRGDEKRLQELLSQSVEL